MTVPQSDSRIPGLSVRLRTLLAITALLALLFAAVCYSLPEVLKRQHRAQALEFVLKNGPHTPNPPRHDEFLELLSGRPRVLASLLHAAEHDKDPLRQLHAVQTIHAILRQDAPQALRRQYLDRFVHLAVYGQMAAPIETELVSCIEDWLQSVGLTRVQRAAILSRTRTAPPNRLPAWAHLLSQIGGREETLLLISLADSHNPKVIYTIDLGQLRGSAWPGLFPHLKRWLADPKLAPLILDYFLLSHTAEGRDLLLAYASNPENPPAKRIYAIKQLESTITGVNLLLSALDDPAVSAEWSTLFGGDPHNLFQTALMTLEQKNGDDLWTVLISGLSDARLHETSLHELQFLSGRNDLETPDEWQRWFQNTQPAPVPLSKLLLHMLEDPLAFQNFALYRRIVPYHLAAIPPDCIPLYIRLARESFGLTRILAYRALLHLSPNTDSVPMLIDLIEQDAEDFENHNSWMAIDLLKQRFAHNDFWDATAWRAWWKEESKKPNPSSP